MNRPRLRKMTFFTWLLGLALMALNVEAEEWAWAFGAGVGMRATRDLNVEGYLVRPQYGVILGIKKPLWQFNLEGHFFEAKSQSGSLQVKWIREELMLWSNYQFWGGEGFYLMAGAGVGHSRDQVDTTLAGVVDRRMSDPELNLGVGIVAQWWVRYPFGFELPLRIQRTQKNPEAESSLGLRVLTLW